MISKTPQFDKALDEILKDLKPQKRVCKQCGLDFQIEKEDVDFYEILRVPPPTKCPSCRQGIRKAFINYTTFFKRDCSVSGHKEKIISQIPDNSPFPVYDFDYYWSGDWNPFSYGGDIKVNERFFDQFRQLLNRVPQPATTRDPMSINSDYSSYGLQLKNCYYMFGGLYSENVLYGNWPMRTRMTMEVLVSWDCERCYEIVYPEHCYNCKFVYYSNGCLDSSFIYDCQNCRNCFGCVSLRNKNHHFFNQPLSKEEYEERIKEIDLGDREVLNYWKTKFLEFLAVSPKRITFNPRSVNSIGNLLEDCRDCYKCFFIKKGQNNRYAEVNLGAKDCMDLLLGTNPSRCYETVLPYSGSGHRFVLNCRGECLDLEYTFNMRDCSNCFGCVGLRNKHFCIFNKQYTEDEYWSKVDEIKTAMLTRKEYGEYFPMSFSPFPYNASMAQLAFPLTKEEGEKKGLWWQEPQVSDFIGKVITKEQIPKNIKDVKDDILESAIRCEATGRPFRIIKEELDFYRREGLPIPLIHPAARLKDRFSWVGYFRIEKAICAKCSKEILSSLPRGMTNNIYCQECFNKELV